MCKGNKILVIGLGNPILGDDGAGWKIVQEVEALAGTDRDQSLSNIEFVYLSLGGLALMEHTVGFEDVIVVDMIVTGTKPNGTIYSLPLSKLPNLSSGHTTAIHDTSLATALEFGQKMGINVPKDVWVVAIEAENVYEFSEDLSPSVSVAIPRAVKIIMEMIKNNLREENIYDIT